MKIRARFALLLGSLLATFAVGTWLLHFTQERESRQMYHSILQERMEMLDQLLTLNGQSLRTFAMDYSLWGEMAHFLDTGDRQWAQINIDPSLPNFNAHAAWILRSDGSTHYAANRLPDTGLERFPFPEPEFLAALRAAPSLHFFHNSPAGLLEIRAAPIQPSEDVRRVTPALGWFVVARLWDEAHLRRFAEPLHSRIGLEVHDEHAVAFPEVHFHRDLHDWRGQVIRQLHVNYQPEPLVELLEGNYREAYLFYGFGVAVLVFVVIAVSGWILTPLRRLGQSLETERLEPLHDLARQPNEFGHLARLVEHSFSQRDALRHEISERARTESSLREAEASLQHLLELRSRLARDLHDGVIQSIYAAGLGLEGVRGLMQTDPARANEHLVACQQVLNRTIAEVRNFITGLEPEHPSTNSFLQSLTTLASTMEAFQQVRIRVEVDPAVAGRLSPEQELHALQIAREAISNALRHANAGTIQVTLQPGPDDSAALQVTDDGIGFDPERRKPTGRGLTNIGTRVREMNGTLHIESGLEKGTRLTIHFQLRTSSPPCPTPKPSLS
ncbi:MAG: hypothetical protein JNG83_04165 [Opitutaceae bacterium]|nr:hypothetical protein [Opitutaceae bacterium]